MTPTDKQLAVLKGMIAAVIVSIAMLATGALVLPEGWWTAETTDGRLRLLATCCLAISIWLLAAIGRLARHRFFTPADIDGSGLTQGTDTAKRLQAVLQNTLEQTVLAVLAYGCFAALAPGAFLGMLPAAAFLFWIGRVLFWHSYARGAGARAFGFALTFYSTVLLWISALILSFL